QKELIVAEKATILFLSFLTGIPNVRRELYFFSVRLSRLKRQAYNLSSDNPVFLPLQITCRLKPVA
ncbi:MAG: hypothetical protein QNJ46_32055, partial [Leptolyngbyaceae cyanobacterium MO_188.B28]|nr:hypothetical protein [Leptolyngbyaceae cyanobacterium MO_188.B28]